MSGGHRPASQRRRTTAPPCRHSRARRRSRRRSPQRQHRDRAPVPAVPAWSHITDAPHAPRAGLAQLLAELPAAPRSRIVATSSPCQVLGSVTRRAASPGARAAPTEPTPANVPLLRDLPYSSSPPLQQHHVAGARQGCRSPRSGGPAPRRPCLSVLCPCRPRRPPESGRPQSGSTGTTHSSRRCRRAAGWCDPYSHGIARRAPVAVALSYSFEKRFAPRPRPRPDRPAGTNPNSPGAWRSYSVAKSSRVISTPILAIHPPDVPVLVSDGHDGSMEQRSGLRGRDASGLCGSGPSRCAGRGVLPTAALEIPRRSLSARGRSVGSSGPELAGELVLTFDAEVRASSTATPTAPRGAGEGLETQFWRVLPRYGPWLTVDFPSRSHCGANSCGQDRMRAWPARHRSGVDRTGRASRDHQRPRACSFPARATASLSRLCARHFPGFRLSSTPYRRGGPWSAGHRRLPPPPLRWTLRPSEFRPPSAIIRPCGCSEVVPLPPRGSAPLPGCATSRSGPGPAHGGGAAVRRDQL